MSTELSGEFSIAFIQLQVQLAAQDLSFKVTLAAEPGRGWKYNLSEARKDSCLSEDRSSFGRSLACSSSEAPSAGSCPHSWPGFPAVRA